MTLNPLTLSVTTGVVGHPFRSKVNGTTTGSVVEATTGGDTGFLVTSDGFAIHDGLSYDLQAIEMRETLPSTGEKRVTRVLVTAAFEGALRAQALATVTDGIHIRAGGISQADGSLLYSMFVEDRFGSTSVLPIHAADVTPPVVTPITPTGFALNGSTNPALKAMLASKQGIIVEKGDSVTAGAGGAVTADGTSSNLVTQCTGARPYRTSNVIAGLMTAAGYPAFDNGWCGDGHLTAYLSRATFDPRLGGTPLDVLADQRFAGGGSVNGQGPETFTLGGVDTFELIVYNIGVTLTLLIDGAAPVSITSTGGGVSDNTVAIPGNNVGFTRVVAKASSLGTHSISYSGGAYIRSVRGYNSASPGIHFINHAAAEATGVQQASAGTEAWFNREAITFDAPKLTIIRVGLNDAAGGSDTSAYQTALQALVDTAKGAGSDVLVLWSNAANPASFSPTATQDAYRNAASAVAASSEVAFGDIRAALGDWNATGARTADGIVHPNRSYHADIGAYIWSCIQAMAA